MFFISLNVSLDSLHESLELFSSFLFLNSALREFFLCGDQSKEVN